MQERFPIGDEHCTSIGDVLAGGADTLRLAGIAAASNDAEILLSHLLDTGRGELFLRRNESLSADVARGYAEGIRRRAAREPLQHVTGEQEFCGLSFRTDARALIPRPETEGLVEVALALGLTPRATVIDLGTGGGCIAVTLALRRPDLRLLAVELSPGALSLARENAARHGVTDRIDFVETDMRRPPGDWLGAADLVVSNPPYVRASEWEELEPEVRDHDPREALVSGPTGVEIYASLVPAAFGLLRPGGRLVLELGYGQADEVRRIVEGAGFTVAGVRPDMRGIDRVLSARRPEERP